MKNRLRILNESKYGRLFDRNRWKAVYSKSQKIVEDSKLTKKENLGKEYWQPIAYCTSFESALKFVPQQVLRSNHDILVIKDKLEQIENFIKQL